ncbi:MAG: succinate dehydrogenase, cytochrome b556 subunit [Candidatus Scalinduaceae bacterium]
MYKVKAFLNDLRLNLTTGTVSYITHRITGIAFLIFLFLHVFTLSSVFRGTEAFENSLILYDNPFGYSLEFALMFAVSIHLINGIRITIIDFFNLSYTHKKYFWITFVVFLIIVILSIAVFFPVF